MLCYICLDKRGDHIKKRIIWSLWNNNKKIINNENVECEIIDNVIKYKEDYDNYNIIDLNKKIYIRESKDFTFKIDFINKNFDYILKEQDIRIEEAPLEATYIKDNNSIKLIYKLEDEEKKIIIQIL